MSCSPAPVALRLWHDTQTRYGARVSYLGIVGDSAHATRVSGHNCGPLQESPIGGVDYDDDYAHALDIKVNGDRALALAIVALLLLDTRTRYVIFDGVGYYPAHRGGGTFESFDHEDHVHWSGMPGSTFDTRPFYVGATSGADDEEAELMAAKDEIQRDIRLAAQVQIAATAEVVDAAVDELRAKVTKAHALTRRIVVEHVADVVNDALADVTGAKPIDVSALVEAVDAAIDEHADDLKVDTSAIVADALAQLPPAQ